MIGRILAVAILGVGVPGQAPVSFENDVLPILRAKCFDCHQAAQLAPNGREQKPKGGLRLDGRDWIRRGGDGEDAIVAGNLEESGIYRRTTLPEDDADFMPAKGEPLTQAERALVAAWIEQGAEFGDWVGAAGPTAETAPPKRDLPVVVPPIHAMWAAVATGLRPLPASAIERAIGGFAQATPVLPDSPLLRVAFRSFETKVGDRELAGLGAIAPNVTQLNLARTKVTDAGLAILRKMPRLTRLELQGTAVTDRGIAQLTHSPELRTVNLYGTAITDAALESLASLEKLESLYVWQTAVTPRGLAAFRQKSPAVRVIAELDLPEAPEPSPDDNRRRRRR
jgi:hypothetical protein